MNKWLNKKVFRKIALILFIITIILFNINTYGSKIEFYSLLLTISFFLYSFVFESASLDAYHNEECTCPNCNSRFKLKTVKFGLCPQCKYRLENCDPSKYLGSM